MGEDLELLIRRIRVRIRANEPSVIEDAVKLAAQYPQDSDAWDVLAYAYAHEDRYSEATAALTRAIEVDPQRMPLFLERGEYELRLGNHECAIADFSQALILCDQQNVDWCRKELHFLRAEAFTLSGKKAEALTDLARVPDEYAYWTAQVPSKAELLALCADAVTPENNGQYNGPPEPPPENAEDAWQLPESPEEDEAALANKLGPEGLAKADATLLKWIPRRQRKVAFVLVQAIEADDFHPTDTFVCVYLRRLIALAEAGKVEAAGDLRRPRFSEVCLPDQDA